MAVLDVEESFYYKELQCQDDSNLSCNSYDRIGVVWMTMKLVDLGPYKKTDQKTWEDNFRASILDDSLTYKIIDELEAWKERHQEIFYIELKNKEKRYLNRFSEEWKEPREELDTLHSLSVFQGHTEVVTLIVSARQDKIVPGSDTHSIEVWKLRNNTNNYCQNNSKKRQVFITFEDDSRPMAMNTDDKGRIALSMINRISPHVTALTYNDNNDVVCVVDISTDLLHYLLPDNIKKFQVVKSEKTNQPSAASDRLAHLVNEMKKIRSNKTTSGISEKSFNITQSTAKKSLTANKIKEKKVTVGFKYRSSKSMNYVQLKKGQGGGLQDLTLCNTKEYTVAEIIELSKSQFLAKEKLSSVYLEGSTIKLGLFSGEPFDNFLDDGGNKIDLWKFIENNKSGGVPLKLYLYVCQPVHPESHKEKLALTLSQDSSFDKTSTPVTEEHLDSIKKRKFSSIDDCQYLDVFDINFDENDQENNKCMLSSDIVSIEPTNSQQDDDNNNNDDDYDVENLFEIFIEYYEISISDYSHKESISTLRKKDIWERKEHQIYPPIEYSNFYPLEHGVFLASISRNNDKLLHIYQDDLGQNVYSFPCLKKPPVPHSVLYKCEELFGKYEDTFGFGIITACTTTCNPQYKWYCNGIPIASGPHLPWYSLQSKLKETDIYSIEHTCNKTPLKVQEKYYTDLYGIKKHMWIIMDAPDLHNIDPEKSNDTHDEARKQVEQLNEITHITDNTFLERIEKNELTFLSSLGEGTQGKVSMGEYLGTPVAIKTVAQRRLKYTNNQIRLINRELKVLGSLRHPNVVLAIGACQEPKVYHIVMEYVSGHNLGDIIFEDEIKKKYDLTEPKKNLIGHQLVQAVTYLHNKKNPVIHRDINPENIMCTIDCLVKLCDMGVSKFQQNSLMTTVGVIAKGTPLYLSPELLTEEKIESSTFSDVWATACTIIELYNEALVWEIDEEKEQLIDVIERQKIPNVAKVPVKIKSKLLTCFSKNPKERSLSGLLHEYSKLSKSQYK